MTTALMIAGCVLGGITVLIFLQVFMYAVGAVLFKLILEPILNWTLKDS